MRYQVIGHGSPAIRKRATMPPKHPKSPNPSELPLELLERALAEDAVATAKLLERYWPDVWWTVAARIRPVRHVRCETADLAGAVWIELLSHGCKRLRGYDPKRGTLGNFIRLQAAQIAWRQIQALLKLEEIPTDQLEAIDENQERRLYERDMLDRLYRKARTELTKSELELFIAVYVEGWSPAEFATRQNKHQKAVYQLKFRLKQKLERFAQELLEPRSHGEATMLGDPPAAAIGIIVASLVCLLTPQDGHSSSVTASWIESLGSADDDEIT